jgi:hypothetical protein
MMKENIVTVAGPSTPVSVLGLDGAATAGDKFNILKTKEAKQIASKRSQLMREQSVRNVTLHWMKLDVELHWVNLKN